MTTEPRPLHAPGPWSHSPQEGGKNHCNVAQVWDANGNSLACIDTTDDPAEATANAALIARAPELQATLTAVRTELATLQATHQRNVELLAHATEKAVELTAENERLKARVAELESVRLSAMVLVYQPELTHSVWQDYGGMVDDETGEEVIRSQDEMIEDLKAGVLRGDYMAWRLIRIEKEVMGNE